MTSTAERDLGTWLDWQLSVHPNAIDLGLARVGEVGRRLDVIKPAPTTVLVAGTNGKGSSAAWVRALWPTGQRVGVFSSPHLWRYNERVTVDGVTVGDDMICRAFEAIESVRGDTRLTYFEYSALCAMWCFKQASVDLAVLEVGLGGRLDATNIVDADAALITSIGLDHMAWLGTDREQIGAEKAGVMRPERPVVIADRDPPAVLAQHAETAGSVPAQIGREFDLAAEDTGWQLRLPHETYRLPTLSLGVVPENFAGAAALVASLNKPLAAEQVMQALQKPPHLPGRCQIVDGTVRLVYDVGHNTEAVAVLVDQLMAFPVHGRTRVVLGMLEDKPVDEVIERLRTVADMFYPAGLDQRSPRGLAGNTLAKRIGKTEAFWATAPDAFDAAWDDSNAGDRIVVCGSFHTVSGVLADNIAVECTT
ncbi:bifunctional tetrahydrofolate synthase/dihydrofolate synthase [Salinisphaera sp. USBA-960]|uniref:bifunctional tetrahydrofolate synthase/dihydrofolate synthase n=1 Tax=Salinisphaera orenii TaxID=856731 RepID=UPI0013A6779D|nr:bifunctional tetrahydrofolate synthase/dihydrofolate synthase [Salifodinibacter halophilus]NNC26108.1 bifunctional tetrahydrofolate synthase/dihydrofolate synthase [Salifodinibacter halophilus]